MSNHEPDNRDKNVYSTPFRCFFRPISLKIFSNVVFPTVYAHDSVFTLPFLKTDHDSVKSKVANDLNRINETGLDRLKQMFSTDEYSRLGPEWSLMIHGTFGGVIAGSFLGGLSGARKAKDQHLRETQATKFQTEMHARRALQDRITLMFMKDALKYGTKVGAFTFLYLFSTAVCSVYRGKTNVLDFVAGGAISGALWRITLSPKATLVSGVLGSVLGLMAGTLSIVILRLSNTSFEELRYWHYNANKVTWRSEVFRDDFDEKQPFGVSQQVDNKLANAASSPPPSSEAVDLKLTSSS